MRAALEQLWASQRDQANKGFEALVTADKDAGGDGQWWLRYDKCYGPSRFFGVRLHDGRWEVQLTVDGKWVYFGRCDEETDAARFADVILVVVRGEAPKNFPKAFVEFLETGGDVPAALVAAALRRVGRVDVNQSDDGAEARDAAAAVEAKIAAKKDDPRTRDDYFTFLSDIDVPGLEWMLDLADALEEECIETVGDLARVDVDNRALAMAVTNASQYGGARRTLWNWKRAAADFLGVEIPKKPPLKNGTGKAVSKRERTTPEQDALDVAARWAASRAGTADDEAATEYATALAAIARRQLSKNSSGGDGVAKPLRKKQHC